MLQPIEEQIMKRLLPHIMQLIKDNEIKYADFKDTEVVMHYMDEEIKIKVTRKPRK
jgi:ribosomal protein S18